MVVQQAQVEQPELRDQTVQLVVQDLLAPLETQVQQVVPVQLG